MQTIPQNIILRTNPFWKIFCNTILNAFNVKKKEKGTEKNKIANHTKKII